MTFLDEREISAGAIAVSYNGQLIESAGKGRQADDNAPVASLSKAITAICTMKALEATNFQLSSSLLDIMPQRVQDNTTSATDTRLQNVTVAQLLTHNSGIEIQHIAPLGSTLANLGQERKDLQFSYIFENGLSASPGSGYVYANANYLFLGVVIESLVQEDYESYCQREVLEIQGIDSAALSTAWTFLSSYGGWDISAIDYLTFINAYFNPDDLLGMDPQTTTLFTTIEGDVRYSLGTTMRLTDSGALFWHDGSFTWQTPAQSGRFGSYFAVYPNGFSVAVNLSDDLRNGRGAEVDFLLYDLFR